MLSSEIQLPLGWKAPAGQKLRATNQVLQELKSMPPNWNDMEAWDSRMERIQEYLQ